VEDVASPGHHTASGNQGASAYLPAASAEPSASTNGLTVHTDKFSDEEREDVDVEGWAMGNISTQTGGNVAADVGFSGSDYDSADDFVGHAGAAVQVSGSRYGLDKGHGGRHGMGGLSAHRGGLVPRGGQGRPRAAVAQVNHASASLRAGRGGEITARGGMRTTQPGAGMSYPGKGGSVRKGLGASSLMTSNFDLRGVYDCKSKTPVMVSVAAGRAVPLRKRSAYKVDDDYFDEDASDCDEQQPAFEGREDSCDDDEDYSDVRSPPRHFMQVASGAPTAVKLVVRSASPKQLTPAQLMALDDDHGDFQSRPLRLQQTKHLGDLPLKDLAAYKRLHPAEVNESFDPAAHEDYGEHHLS